MVRRTRPYNTLSIYFQGVIFFPTRCRQPTDQQPKLANRVARVDISLANLLKAAYVGTAHYAPKTWPSEKNTPADWWYWAYVKIHPQAKQWADQTSSAMTQAQMQEMFGGYHTFKHDKTKIQLLAFESTNFQPNCVASLLVQDNFWQDQNELADYFPSFMELTANGAPWSFPPGLKSVSRGSFNHHTMVGTNDPIGEPWKILKPVNPSTPTQVDWIYGTLFLASSSQTVPRDTGATYQGLASPSDIWNVWAVARIKSKWTLGNLSKRSRMDIRWPGSAD